MSKINIEEVGRIAKLARIGLSDAETNSMTLELGKILEFVEQLQKVDISDIPPTDQVTGLEDVWREDVVKPSMAREALLANAPDKSKGCFRVPKIIE